MNALCPGLGQETGEVSRIERGRHTTRKAQLFPTPGGGYLADTPGFSLLELDAQDPDTLKDSYPEFAPYEGQCRFLGCQHIGEPDCAVKPGGPRGASFNRTAGALCAFASGNKRKMGEKV